MSLIYRSLARRFGAKSRGDFDRRRREVLKASLAASAALLIPSSPLLAAGERRVVIVGAGLGGLSCGYQLRKAGYDVTVVEARDRIGGRVLSFNRRLGSEFIRGRNVEGGGELVGTNHPTWIGYAAEFGLELKPVNDDGELAFPMWLAGRRLSAAEGAAAYEEMERTLAQMTAESGAILADRAWDSPNAAALDQRSVQQWLDSAEASPLAKRTAWALLGHDNGVTIDRQSYLGLLAAIRGGGGDAYWTETDAQRCEGGNQQLAHRLARKVGRDRVLLGLPVTSIELQGERARVTGADGRVIDCDDVVVAVPPSTWPNIRFDPALPAALTPQMGRNVKYLAHVKKRFWKESGTGQYAISDEVIGWTWDATDGQRGETDACLTAFSGAVGAETARSWTAAERDANYRAEYEKLHPKFGENFVASRFMDWPTERWTAASYSFPAPGEVMTIGPLLRDGLQGRVHFAGEHCSYAFSGYMEGALNSGAALARRLAVRDGVLRA